MAGKQLEQELKTKAEVTKALADSYALCDDLFASLTDANVTEMVKARSERSHARRQRSTGSSSTAMNCRHRLRVLAVEESRAAPTERAQGGCGVGETSEIEN